MSSSIVIIVAIGSNIAISVKMISFIVISIAMN